MAIAWLSTMYVVVIQPQIKKKEKKTHIFQEMQTVTKTWKIGLIQ